jgi:hypothetical protein
MRIKRKKKMMIKEIDILNLFAYTGGASIACTSWQKLFILWFKIRNSLGQKMLRFLVYR